jgi:hypothetical protein
MIGVLKVNEGHHEWWEEFAATIEALPPTDLRHACIYLWDHGEVAGGRDLVDRIMLLMQMVPGWGQGSCDPVQYWLVKDRYEAVQLIERDNVLMWSIVDDAKHHFVAIWDHDIESYVVEDRQWFSEDGNQWIKENGSTVKTKEFQQAWIWLVGGPCDGLTVC